MKLTINKLPWIVLTLLTCPSISIAKCSPDSTSCYNTTLGTLEQKERVDSGDDYSHLILNGKEIYKKKTSYMVISNDDGVFKGNKYLITKATISYVSDTSCYPDKHASRCGMNVILDLTSDKPVISNEFFSEFGDSNITWVSWGKKNSIIVIDNELRFKYSNGHVERITKVKEPPGDSSEEKEDN